MSIIKELITKEFDEFIGKTFVSNPEVRKLIENHERKNLCIENLDTEIRKVQLSGYILQEHELITIVRDFALTFARSALKLKEEESMHYLEKQKRLTKIAEMEEMKQIVKEVDLSEELNG